MTTQHGAAINCLLQMIEATSLLQRACDLHLSNLYQHKLHFADYISSPKTATELAAELGYVESARIVIVIHVVATFGTDWTGSSAANKRRDCVPSQRKHNRGHLR